MRILILIIICTWFPKNLIAQDSLNSIKKKPKWSLIFAIDNNYNYRYVRKPNFLDYGYPVNYDYTQADLDYLDTSNIACNMKSIGLKIERSIWKFIAFQSGFVYGRKGYMGCRDVEETTFKTGSIYRLYYTRIPLPTLSIPVGLCLNKTILNNKLIISVNSGMEVNFITKKFQANDFKMNIGKIKDEKSGFFGFSNLKDVDDNLYYEPHEFGTINSSQYYAGLNIKYLIFKNTFIHLGYSYISEFKFHKTNDRLHSSAYIYEKRSYIQRYGAGIGLCF